MNRILTSLSLVVAAIVMAGCASTAQPSKSSTLGENLKGSGFLAEIYPQMQDGKEGEVLRIYRNPKFNAPERFVQYTKIFLEPVQLYAGPESKLHEIPQEELAAIAQDLYRQLHEQLGKDYQMVSQAGPNTLQLSAAIVDAEEADASSKALSYLPVLPGAKMAAVQSTKAITGKPPFSGQVTVEGKIVDAQTGEVIAAEIDRRVGARRPIIGLFESNTYDSWSDVAEADRYWAEQLRYRLCMRRAASNCVKASE